jgi:hypothetical protein
MFKPNISVINRKKKINRYFSDYESMQAFLDEMGVTIEGGPISKAGFYGSTDFEWAVISLDMPSILGVSFLVGPGEDMVYAEVDPRRTMIAVNMGKPDMRLYMRQLLKNERVPAIRQMEIDRGKAYINGAQHPIEWFQAEFEWK